MHLLFWQIPRRIAHRVFLYQQALRSYPFSVSSKSARDRRLVGREAHLFTMLITVEGPDTNKLE